MILTCPNCATRFALDPARLGVQGRTVRCARCLNTWFAEAPDDLSPLGVAEKAGARDNPLIDDPFDNLLKKHSAPQPDSDSGSSFTPRFGDRLIRPEQSEAADRETRNLPALLTTGRLGTLLGWSSLALFVALIIGIVLLFARDITSTWPAAHKLYDTFGLNAERSLLAHGPAAAVETLPLEKRLKLLDLAPSQRFINGTLTLVISGKIQNISPRDETLPPIEVVLLDGQKLDLKTWVFEPPQKTLKSGGIVPFETRLENPPPAAQDIRVTFSTPASVAKPAAVKSPAIESGAKTP
ncbi:MJ0042-type zinc finger domain-containing protein [Govanella unica]|uniref:DUF3426 domain-containing protein n=1 Tax=Govanella unica TaxID=2975056 RepID=A0A9X3Z5Y2_9PROT|nr:MJ0042-type zinc finger domain-containing protein [Govania unica]MDA5192600.1 DUF3426 domain-containing protein [Govania unica]